MRIAQIAPLQVSVPPAGYGGTERCIDYLTESLVKLGHDVTLFATGDSRTSAKLVAGFPKAINFDVRIEAGAAYLNHIEAAYEQADQFDVIHSHVDYLTLPASQTTKTPTVITLHGNVARPEFVPMLRRYRDKTNFVAISQSQRSQMPDLNWVGTIHHAVDLNRFKFYPDHGDYLAFVGRFSPEKCPDRAIEIAKRVGMRLIMAAKVDYQDQEYFDTVVKPLLKHPLIEYVGTVGEEEKQELMGRALALVVPIDWPEPFGMVFIESLAVGTPVLTTPLGSVPELLEDGVTGFVRAKTEDLAACVEKVYDLSRERCRAYVRKKFDIMKMALEYVNAYARVQRRPEPFRFTPDPLSPDPLNPAGEVLLG